MTARDLAARRLERWATQQEPALARVILSAWREVQASVDVRALVRLLDANDLDGLVTLLFAHTDALQAEATIRGTYARAVQTTREHAARTFTVRVASPVADQQLVELVRQWENTAFRRIAEGVRAGLREMVATELARGIGPRQVAIALKSEIGRVGLTAYDERIIASYRRALTEGRTADALQRTVRDRRFDRSVRVKGPLTTAQVDTMTAAYRRKLVAFRAETHARTAAMQAANDGNTAAWEDAVAQGRIPLDQVRRYWIVSPDERLCVRCAPIPGLNPRGVGLRESFRTPEGLLRSPVRHPNCRCTVFSRVERPTVRQRPQPGTERLILTGATL